MDNDLVEVWIILLELLEGLLFVNLKDLLFNPQPLSLIFSSFFDHVIINHVFEGRFGLQGPDFSQSPDANILEGILQPPSFLLLFEGQILGDQVLRHIHDVIQRVRLVLQKCILLKRVEFSLQVLVPWEDFLKHINRQHVEDRVPTEPVEDLSIFLHKESSVIDDRPPEQLLQHKLEFILSLCVNFDHTVLQKIEVRGVVTRSLKDIILVVFLSFKVVDDVVKSFVIDVLEVLDLLERLHNEHFDPILVGEDMLHQLLFQIWELDQDVLVVRLLQFS